MAFIKTKYKRDLLDSAGIDVDIEKKYKRLQQDIKLLKQQNNLLRNAYYDLMLETGRITKEAWERFKEV